MLELALKRYKLLVVYFDSYTIPSGMMLVIYSIVFSRTGLSPRKWKSSVRRALMKIDCRDWGIEIQYICSAGNLAVVIFSPLFHATYRPETKINPDLWIQRKTNTLFSVPNFLLVYLDISQLTLIELSHFSPARNLFCCSRKCPH